MSVRVSVAAAVNDPAILSACLARSPDIANARLKLQVLEDFATAGLAYNAGLDAADADVVLFIHQDVYLPRGTLERAEALVAELDVKDPDWAVAGVVGRDLGRVVQGQTWSSGMARLVGRAMAQTQPATALDEMLLIFNRRCGLRFDADLPSFHLFGTDIVLSARKAGKSAWIVNLPVVHNSRPVRSLGGGYAVAYRYMQRKWAEVLPVWTLVLPITRSPLKLFVRDLKLRLRNRGRTDRPMPTRDAQEIARELGYE